VVLSRTFAMPRRPRGGHEASLEPPVPIGHPTRDRIGCHRLPDLGRPVMGYASPVDPGGPKLRSRHVVERCFAHSVEVANVVVTHISDIRSPL
jgi:hypothetical protein